LYREVVFSKDAAFVFWHEESSRIHKRYCFTDARDYREARGCKLVRVVRGKDIVTLLLTGGFR